MNLVVQVAEAFAPAGVLARTTAHFVPRSGQTEMAVAVARAIEDGHALVVEAGTGVGKTFSYLVPALLSGERVLLSTATKALPMLEKYFGSIPAGPAPVPLATIEPPQQAEKSVTLEEPTQPFYIEGYHRPDYLDKDDAVYDAISDIMSNGRTSLLYRSLVRDQKIAAAAAGFSGFPGDKYPNLFAFYAVPTPGHTPQQMRAAIHAEIDKLKAQDVTDDELAMFKTRARADILRGLDNNQSLAEELGTYQLRYGDWRMLFQQLNKIDAVSKADIRRVANDVFTAKNRTSARIEFTPAKPLKPRPGAPAQPEPHSAQSAKSSAQGGR